MRASDFRVENPLGRLNGPPDSLPASPISKS